MDPVLISDLHLSVSAMGLGKQDQAYRSAELRLGATGLPVFC
jgi:hypothetical protein